MTVQQSQLYQALSENNPVGKVLSVPFKPNQQGFRYEVRLKNKTPQFRQAFECTTRTKEGRIKVCFAEVGTVSSSQEMHDFTYVSEAEAAALHWVKTGKYLNNTH